MARSAAIHWCDTCEDWTACRSENPSIHGHSDVRQWVTEDGVHFFRRMRVCVECGEEFMTVEIKEPVFNAMEKAQTTLETVRKAIRVAR